MPPAESSIDRVKTGPERRAAVGGIVCRAMPSRATALLKESDPAWPGTSVWLQAIRAPEHLEGELTPDA